jgi:hypothetical protein
MVLLMRSTTRGGIVADGSIANRLRVLQGERDLLSAQLQNFEGDAHWDPVYRSSVCDDLRRQISGIDSRMERLRTLKIVCAISAVLVAVLWIVASIVIGVFVKDAYGAIFLWIGIGIGAVIGICLWVRMLIEDGDARRRRH